MRAAAHLWALACPSAAAAPLLGVPAGLQAAAALPAGETAAQQALPPDGRSRWAAAGCYAAAAAAVVAAVRPAPASEARTAAASQSAQMGR